MGDDMEAVVLDNGSGVVKAGFAGEDTPRAVFAACVGVAKNPEWLATQQPTLKAAVELRESFVGAECQQLREVLDVVHPITRGVVEDWDALERIWEHVFTHELRVNPETTTLPILCTSSPSGSKQQQERMAQLMFESQKVCGFYFMHQCALSLFASGRTRGLVVEVGHGASHAVPIFEGYALPHAALACGVGGVDISHRLHKLLAKRGHAFHAFQLHTIDAIKEAVCVVQGGRRDDWAQSDRDAAASSSIPKPFELPDGTVLHVDRQTRSLPADVLFRPQELGDEHPRKPTNGLHECAAEAIAMCDKDLQTDLRAAVVLAGGTTMLPGFSQRFQDELLGATGRRLPAGGGGGGGAGAAVRVVPDPHVRERGYNSQRRVAAWVGGSMLASLGTFRDMHITKQEWDEYHEAILDRKCF
ncbi:hypothetical protein PybrP1_002641 [[Pythium] brassicae (nom. inval.)]|nr:hypothetical protein PybrP1_002641 [[Pythium] brassicae (nom. inval.)]